MSAIFSPMMHLFAVLDELFTNTPSVYSVSVKQAETPIFSLHIKNVPGMVSFEVINREATRRNVSEIMATLYNLYQ